MGLGTLIDIQSTSMSSEQFIGMRIKDDCDGETVATMSRRDHIISTTLEPSSLHLDNGLSLEVKDALSPGHSNLRHVIQLSEAQEDVPSDPFVSSAHELKGVSKIHAANGGNAVLAIDRMLGEFDTGICPHDPEPSTSKEGLSGNEHDKQTVSTVNSKHSLVRNSNHVGNSIQSSTNGLNETAGVAKEIVSPLTISVLEENNCGQDANTNQQNFSSSSALKHAPNSVNHTQQAGSCRRTLIGAAPLSPNHYGPVLTPTSPSFQVNKQRSLSMSQRQSSLPSDVRGMPTRRERNFLPGNIKDMQIKRQKMQEDLSAAVPHSSLSPSIAAAGTGDDQLQIPNEQVLNQALDLLRKPVQDGISESKSTAKRTYPKKVNSFMDNRDGSNRKILQEKIGKLRDRVGLALSVPHLERAHLSQLVNLLQRFKNHFAIGDFLSKEVSDFVFGDSAATSIIEKPKNDARNDVAEKVERSEDRLMKYVVDPDATESEYSDEEVEEQMPSTSSAPSAECLASKYYRERVHLGTLDAKALCMEEDCEEKINEVYRQLASFRRQKKAAYSWTEESLNERCSRCMPFDGTIRRLLKKRKIENNGDREPLVLPDAMERVHAYSTVDSRVCSQLSSISALPVERRAEVYCYRRSTRPSIHLRKRFDRSPWTSFLEERKVAVKEAVIVDERQIRRKRERSESDESYENDEEYQPTNYSQRTSHSKRTPSLLKRGGQKFVRRSVDRKRESDSRIRKNSDFRLRQSRTTDVEEGVMEPLPGLPQKIDYKEICIPRWERKPLKLIPEDDSGCMHLAENSCIAEISRRHLPYELNERKRFQQYRDYVAAKSASTASKLSGSSHSKLRAASTAPSATASIESSSLMESAHSVSAVPSPAVLYGGAFDDEQPSPTTGESSTTVPDYDRPSVVQPYPVRNFPIPPCVSCRLMKSEGK